MDGTIIKREIGEENASHMIAHRNSTYLYSSYFVDRDSYVVQRNLLPPFTKITKNISTIPYDIAKDPMNFPTIIRKNIKKKRS
jgi:hypothetical protein